MILQAQALLFDMDGTLVDSTACVERTWERWGAEHGIPLSTILAVSHGRRTADTIRDVAPHLDAETEAHRLDQADISDGKGVIALQGAQALLRSLPTDRWAVVTSAPRALAVARLGFAGLPHPPVLIGAEDVRAGKPNPEGYLRAAALLSTAPNDCLVLEDTPAGILAARAAGMRVLAIGTTFPPAELLGAEWVPHYNDVTFDPAT